MRKVLLGVSLLATLALTPAFAAEKASTDVSHAAHGSEVLFGTNLGKLSITTGALTFRMDVGYQRLVMPNLQLGLRGGFGVASTAQAWEALAWATWNLDEKLSDSIFIGVGAGVTNPAGTMNFAAGAEVGKRFELCPGFMYRPTVAVAHTFDGGAYWNFNFNVFNFSYVW